MAVPATPDSARHALAPLVDSPWRIMWRRLRKRTPAMVGLALLVLVICLALFAPLFTSFNPELPNLDYKFAKPGFRTESGQVMIFGGDKLGRDIFTRALYGGRVSLRVGILAAGLSLSLGVVIGAISGYFGGWTDTIIMRVVDVFLSLPQVLILITLVSVLGPAVPKGGEIWLLMGVIGFLGWPGTARLVRGEILSLKERDYVEAARALGIKDMRILFRHIVPNVIGPIIVSGTLSIASAIISEATLSYLGLGIQPPIPSWGNMILDGQAYLRNAWWIVTFPGLLASMTTFSFYMLGDGLREALDPRLKK
ncbi:MAG TPA: ABC transporter permease [Symbiobacteriaceae bacterium]|nr:ABC transporter permease [Symbiobacteriaceae bacterium]